MKGYIVVFEGDDESGFSAYSPDLPGVIAAADTRQETESLMVQAMAAHIAELRDAGARASRGRQRHSPGPRCCLSALFATDRPSPRRNQAKVRPPRHAMTQT